MIVIYILIILIALFLITINLPVFGKLPSGWRLDKIRSNTNYADGALQNLSATPMQPEGVSMFKVLMTFMFGKQPNKSPKTPLPFLEPNLNGKPSSQSLEIIWFGHSSYLIKTGGYRILVDPVFSPKPSPFSFIGSKAFKGTDFIQATDFKNIDVILITHDHYDHMDYPSILKIAPEVKKFITSLGVGSHLEKWGVDSKIITELAWGESVEILIDLKFTATPARHFTGRKFKRNQTLWSSFVMEGITDKVFIGGDSGYDEHFSSIGKEFGPFDLALLECGQYNDYWPFIHMFPEQTVQAAKDLKAKVLMPVHWGKFSLAMHPWNEPINRVVAAAEKMNFPLATPRLGETVVLGEKLPNAKWWEEVAV